ncbi:MAG: hypothetical protein ACJATD_001555 [Alloalcanivorax sp.]|jgi:hypothetical protein
MGYQLCIMAIGRCPEIQLSKDRYIQLRDAKRTLDLAGAIEEKFDLLMSNYLELEKEVLSLTAESMVASSPIYEGFADIRRILNRRVANLLTAAKLYVAHMRQNVKSCDPDSSELGKEVEFLFEQKYDGSFEYRFMEALRNHVQHCGLAIHRTTKPSKWVGEGDSRRRSLGLRIFSERATLEESGKFKSSVLGEMPENVDLLVAARSYVSSLSLIQGDIRTLIDGKVREARECLEEAIKQYKTENNGQATGLVAISYAEGGGRPLKVIEKTSLLLDWDDVRIALSKKNRPAPGLDRSYVSGEI